MAALQTKRNRERQRRRTFRQLAPAKRPTAARRARATWMMEPNQTLGRRREANRLAETGHRYRKFTKARLTSSASSPSRQTEIRGRWLWWRIHSAAWNSRHRPGRRSESRTAQLRAAVTRSPSLRDPRLIARQIFPTAFIMSTPARQEANRDRLRVQSRRQHNSRQTAIDLINHLHRALAQTTATHRSRRILSKANGSASLRRVRNREDASFPCHRGC